MLRSSPGRSLKRKLLRLITRMDRRSGKAGVVGFFFWRLAGGLEDEAIVSDVAGMLLGCKVRML